MVIHEEGFPELQKLYPRFSEQELLEAQANLDVYIEVVARIYQRLLNDSEAKKEWRARLAFKKS